MAASSSSPLGSSDPNSLLRESQSSGKRLHGHGEAIYNDYLLIINIKSAVGLPGMDLDGKSDPYVLIKFGQREYKSKIHRHTLNPIFDEQFRLLVTEKELHYDLSFEVWDWDRLSSDDYIGVHTVNLQSIASLPVVHKQLHNFEYPLHNDKTKKLKGKNVGFLTVGLSMVPRSEAEKVFWQELVTYFDTDSSGSISKMEFVGLLEGIHSTEQQLDEEIFNRIDADSNGEISADELYSFIHTNHSEPLIKKIWPHDSQLIWKAYLDYLEGKSIADLVLTNWSAPVGEISSASQEIKEYQHQILVYNRETSKLEVEKIPTYVRISLRMMYANKAGRGVTSKKKLQQILHRLTISQGEKMNNPASTKEIPGFIAFHHLNEDEMLEPVASFKTFNEFFYRKLKPTARPIAFPDNEGILVSPADCRLNVFQTIQQATELWIKGTKFTLQNLLQNEDLAARFDGGSLMIARLAPQDYHRYHTPIGGRVGEFAEQGGVYYTVNPIAVKESVDVFSSNRRLITTLQTAQFGLVGFIAVGATCVGSINMTVSPGQEVKKGDELGYFAFGGSTCLVLFEPGRVSFDADLVSNSLQPIETLVKVGVRVGEATVA